MGCRTVQGLLGKRGEATAPRPPPPALREAFDGIVQGRKQDARTVRTRTKENPACPDFGSWQAPVPQA